MEDPLSDTSVIGLPYIERDRDNNAFARGATVDLVKSTLGNFER